jgi:two-component system chemotaxis response regulator CheY
MTTDTNHAAAARGEAEAAEATHRILVADDDHMTRQLLIRLLREFTRAELHEARDGPGALERFQTVRPQLTLLDIDMPGLDGMAVLEQIRAADPSAYIVMVTGVSKVELVRKALDLGVGGFVVKPYSAQRIADILGRYVQRTGDAAMLRRR